MLNNFSLNVASLPQPLQELLNPQKAYIWTDAHSEAFHKVKKEIASPRILARYDTKKDTKISADASAYGLGAVLLQLHERQWRPVAFESHALYQTETHYTQIEKGGPGTHLGM